MAAFAPAGREQRARVDGSVETQGGWKLLRGCALPGPLPSALAVVALHPRHGIALVDPLPQVTPDAAARLQQRLRQARFGAVYGEKWPPALHLALHQAEMARLPDVLAEVFQGQPAPELPGGDAWMDTVARALQPDLPLASAPSPSAGRLRQKARPKQPLGLRWRRGLPLAAYDAGDGAASGGFEGGHRDIGGDAAGQIFATGEPQREKGHGDGSERGQQEGAEPR